MIKVERTRVAEPRKLRKAAKPALEELRQFFARAERSKAQRTVRFPIPHIPIVLKPVTELFHSKCAYCEQKVTDDTVHVDPFRPKQNAMGGSGKSGSGKKRASREHYWWLLYEWDNTYASCFTCNRYKASRFPVRGHRANPEATGDELDRQEQRLLLDPCRDQPENHLRFHYNGKVEGLSEIGTTSIEVFGLNRGSLVKARRDQLRPILKQLEELDEIARVPRSARTKRESNLESKIVEQLRKETSDDAEYAGAKRQLIEPALNMGAGDRPVGKWVKALQVSGAGEVSEAVSVVPEFEYGSTWIDRVEIENFKAIKSLSLKFPEPATGYDDPTAELLTDLGLEQDADELRTREPWLVLLGENGTGKSSVLKALSLPFMTREVQRKFVGEPRDLVNRESKSGKGEVRVFFNRGDTPLTARFDINNQFSVNFPPPPIPLIGYGATRLPPLPDGPEPGPDPVNIENLFDPRVGLSDPERWFADTARVSPKVFGSFARSLRQLLNLDDESQISRRNGEILIKLDPRRAAIPLRDHSDGYRSVAALATDIMLNLASNWLEMESAEGTVLLDEIEAHLHPTWRIEIVNRLRRVFPRVRFVSTTHDPLCLHGTRSGEVRKLIREPETGQITSTHLDLERGLRADQLLTGPWFGLASTLDRNTLAIMSAHSRLLAKTRLSRKDKRMIGRLEHELRHRFGGYAETEVERIAIQASSDFVQSRDGGDLPMLSPEEIKRRVMSKVRTGRS